MAEAESRSAPTLSTLQPSYAGPPKSRQLTRVSESSHDDEKANHDQDVAIVATGYATIEQGTAVTEQIPEQRIRAGDEISNELYIEPMEMHSSDDHRQAMKDDASVYGAIPGMPFSPPFLHYVDQDPGYIAPMHAAAASDIPTLASSWPSYDSVELMLDDFLAQVPGGPCLEEGMFEGSFMRSDLPDQILTGREFVGFSPV